MFAPFFSHTCPNIIVSCHWSMCVIHYDYNNKSIYLFVE